MFSTEVKNFPVGRKKIQQKCTWIWNWKKREFLSTVDNLHLSSEFRKKGIAKRSSIYYYHCKKQQKLIQFSIRVSLMSSHDLWWYTCDCVHEKRCLWDFFFTTQRNDFTNMWHNVITSSERHKRYNVSFLSRIILYLLFIKFLHYCYKLWLYSFCKQIC